MLDVYYQFYVGGSGIAAEVTFTGRAEGGNDDLDVVGTWEAQATGVDPTWEGRTARTFFKVVRNVDT